MHYVIGDVYLYNKYAVGPPTDIRWCMHILKQLLPMSAYLFSCDRFYFFPKMSNTLLAPALLSFSNRFVSTAEHLGHVTPCFTFGCDEIWRHHAPSASLIFRSIAINDHRMSFIRRRWHHAST